MPWLADIRRWLDDRKLSLLGFAVAAAYWPGMATAASVPRWGAIAIGVATVSTMDPRNAPEGVRWVLAFLLAVAVMATAWASPDPKTGWLELFFIVLLCLTFFAAAGWSSIDGLMKGLGLGLAVSSALAIWQASDPETAKQFIPQSTAKPAGLFYNSEVLAEFAALMFVWGMLRTKHFIAAVALIPIMLSESRVAGITVIVGLAYAWWPQRWWKRVGVGFVIATVLIGLLFALGGEKMGSADHRLIMWTSTVASWTQFGHGLGWFAAAHPAEEFAHSDALQVIAELGIGGFVLLAVPFIAFRNSRGSHHAERAVFVAVCTQCVISFPLHFPASGFLAAVVAGFLAGHRNRLLVSQHLGRPEDAGDLRWQNAPDAGDLEPCGRGGRAVPVRSVCAGQATLYPQTNFAHSTPT